MNIARKVIAELESKNAALAAENERLRKAGDALAEYLNFVECPEHKGWLAAKEGGAK